MRSGDQIMRDFALAFSLAAIALRTQLHGLLFERTHALEADAHAGEQVVNQHGHIAETSQGRIHPRQQVHDVSQRQAARLEAKLTQSADFP